MLEEIKPLPIGKVINPFGKIVMIGHVGERYYWFKNKCGVISMLPAKLVEEIKNVRRD